MRNAVLQGSAVVHFSTLNESRNPPRRNTPVRMSRLDYVDYCRLLRHWNKWRQWAQKTERRANRWWKTLFACNTDRSMYVRCPCTAVRKCLSPKITWGIISIISLHYLATYLQNSYGKHFIRCTHVHYSNENICGTRQKKHTAVK